MKIYDEKRNELESSLVGIPLSMKLNGPPHHCVVTHQNHKMSLKTLANDMNLGGSNIVSEEKENPIILVQKLT